MCLPVRRPGRLRRRDDAVALVARAAGGRRLRVVRGGGDAAWRVHRGDDVRVDVPPEGPRRREEGGGGPEDEGPEARPRAGVLVGADCLFRPLPSDAVLPDGRDRRALREEGPPQGERRRRPGEDARDQGRRRRDLHALRQEAPQASEGEGLRDTRRHGGRRGGVRAHVQGRGDRGGVRATRTWTGSTRTTTTSS